jgi:hypothetical protein
VLDVYMSYKHDGISGSSFFLPIPTGLGTFLVALRTTLHLDFFRTKAQSPLARISARTAEDE